MRSILQTTMRTTLNTHHHHAVGVQVDQEADFYVGLKIGLIGRFYSLVAKLVDIERNNHFPIFLMLINEKKSVSFLWSSM